MSLPEPYYEKDGIVIYCGDSKQVAPLLPCSDLIVSDPPYGMEYASNRSPKHLQKGGLVGDHEYPRWVFDLPYTVARFVFCRWDNLIDIPQPKSLIVWDKGVHSMGDLLHEYGRQWEGIAFYPGCDHAFVKRPVDIVRAMRVPAEKMLHPTEKPVSVITPLLTAHLKANSVLDPFMGSGTTLVAAKQLGMCAIGIEIEERHCKTAVERLSQEVLDFGGGE